MILSPGIYPIPPRFLYIFFMLCVGVMYAEFDKIQLQLFRAASTPRQLPRTPPQQGNCRLTVGRRTPYGLSAGEKEWQTHLLQVAVAGSQEGDRVLLGRGQRDGSERGVREVHRGLSFDGRNAADLEADLAEVEDVSRAL